MSIAVKKDGDSERKLTWNILESLLKIHLSKSAGCFSSPSKGGEQPSFHAMGREINNYVSLRMICYSKVRRL
jgi:hypothetical protein